MRYDEIPAPTSDVTVWFSDPSQEHIAEETGEEVVLMKDKQGRVIGFEKLNFSSSPEETLDVGFESVKRIVMTL